MATDHRELIKKVQRIQIVTRRMVDDILAGEYHSAFKGRGMEFDEVREYQYGDDIRSIDWNVTARAGKPYIKRFCEERELTIYFLVDVSASLGFGSGDKTKAELAAEISAVLSFAAIKNNDKVALILFSDRIEKFIPPRKGRKAVLRIIRELLAPQTQGQGTDLGLALEFLGRVQRRHAVVFLVSDFISPAYEHSIKIARARYDLISLAITDPREIDLPDIGILELQDAETGEHILVDSRCAQVRALFADQSQQKYRTRQDLFRRNDVDEMQVNTQQSYLAELKKLFRKRSLRLKH